MLLADGGMTTEVEHSCYIFFLVTDSREQQFGKMISDMKEDV